MAQRAVGSAAAPATPVHTSSSSAVHTTSASPRLGMWSPQLSTRINSSRSVRTWSPVLSSPSTAAGSVVSSNSTGARVSIGTGPGPQRQVSNVVPSPVGTTIGVTPVKTHHAGSSLTMKVTTASQSGSATVTAGANSKDAVANTSPGCSRTVMAAVTTKSPGCSLAVAPEAPSSTASAVPTSTSVTAPSSTPSAVPTSTSVTAPSYSPAVPAPPISAQALSGSPTSSPNATPAQPAAPIAALAAATSTTGGGTSVRLAASSSAALRTVRSPPPPQTHRPSTTQRHTVLGQPPPATARSSQHAAQLAMRIRKVTYTSGAASAGDSRTAAAAATAADGVSSTLRSSSPRRSEAAQPPMTERCHTSSSSRSLAHSAWSVGKLSSLALTKTASLDMAIKPTCLEQAPQARGQSVEPPLQRFTSFEPLQQRFLSRAAPQQALSLQPPRRDTSPEPPPPPRAATKEPAQPAAAKEPLPQRGASMEPTLHRAPKRLMTTNANFPEANRGVSVDLATAASLPELSCSPPPVGRRKSSPVEPVVERLAARSFSPVWPRSPVSTAQGQPRLSSAQQSPQPNLRCRRSATPSVAPQRSSQEPGTTIPTMLTMPAGPPTGGSASCASARSAGTSRASSPGLMRATHGVGMLGFSMPTLPQPGSFGSLFASGFASASPMAHDPPPPWPPYQPNPQDPMDLTVFRLITQLGQEALSRLQIRRLIPGKYEIEGRKVTVSHAPDGGLDPLLAREDEAAEGSEQPLTTYLQQALNVAAALRGRVPGGSAVTRIPQEKRLTFSSGGGHSDPLESMTGDQRQESMKKACEEAKQRAKAAEAYEHRHHVNGIAYGRLRPSVSEPDPIKA